jgi:hypothetical protein
VTAPDATPKVTKEEAIEALRAAAWIEQDEAYYEPVEVEYGEGNETLHRKVTPEPRKSVHTFASFIGADWSLESAEEFVNKSEAIEWILHLLRHDLIVTAEGRTIAFDVPNPQRGGDR